MLFKIPKKNLLCFITFCSTFIVFNVLFHFYLILATLTPINPKYLFCLSRVFPMAREIGVQSPVESYQRLKKWYLMPPYLALSTMMLGSRIKWSNPGDGVAPFITPRCGSY